MCFQHSELFFRYIGFAFLRQTLVASRISCFLHGRKTSWNGFRNYQDSTVAFNSIRGRSM